MFIFFFICRGMTNTFEGKRNSAAVERQGTESSSSSSSGAEMGSPSASESSVTAPNAVDSDLERAQTDEEDLPPGWEKHEGKSVPGNDREIYTICFLHNHLQTMTDLTIGTSKVERFKENHQKTKNQPASQHWTFNDKLFKKLRPSVQILRLLFQEAQPVSLCPIWTVSALKTN